jgi:hypothetical protein
MEKKTFCKLVVMSMVLLGFLIFPVLSAQAFYSNAGYDSGWVALDQDSGQVLTHDLGGNVDDYVVFMQFRASGQGELNQKGYGGVDYGPNRSGTSFDNDRHGAYWHSLTDSSITVYRRVDDRSAAEVRVRIFVDSAPDYDSNWFDISAGSTTGLIHNVGGSAGDYIVDMQFKNTAFGINQCYYGGCDFGDEEAEGLRENGRVGVYWRGLSNSALFVHRRPEDDFASQVRVRIFVRPKATFDSDWTAMTADSLNNITHDIGGNPEDYVVDMQFKNVDQGVNQIAYGGMDCGADPPVGLAENDMVGAYWSHMDDSVIKIWRFEQDIYAPEVRIRIWNFWTPSAPSYDSKWTPTTKDGSVSITHNLDKSSDDFLVYLDYKGEDGIVNQRYLGGNDFGTAGFSGKRVNERVGAYWYNLSDNNITIYRRPEDNYAADIRVRIWDMPTPDYDSGWQSMIKGGSKNLTHNLGGAPDDYLVDMEFKNPITGINNRMYGGVDVGALYPSGLNENDRVGAYWTQLTNTGIHVVRRPEDIFASEVRIRIWRIAGADYDSGWVSISTGADQELAHNLEGNLYRYFINMVFDDTNGPDDVNQRHYGGMDCGASASGVYADNDRVGAYWSDLDNSSVTVSRLPEDEVADKVRFRIWRTPPSITLEQILDHILGRTPLPEMTREEADTNGDGGADIADVIYMMQQE